MVTRRPKREKNSTHMSISSHMYQFLINLTFLLGAVSIIGQTLTVQEATQYLSKTVNDDIQEQSSPYGGDRYVTIDLTDTYLTVRYHWSNNADVLSAEGVYSGKDYNEIGFDIRDVKEVFNSKYRDKFAVALKCSSGTKRCFNLLAESLRLNFSTEFADRPNAVNHYEYLHLFYLNKRINQYKSLLALEYILSSVNAEYTKSIKKEIADLEGKTNGKDVVDLTRLKGVFQFDAVLGNQLRVVFILDSGASDVSVTQKVEQQLLNAGIIQQQAYLPPALYSIADGNVVESRRFIIPSIRVNNTVVTNVTCSVNASANVMLLGKSFLDRFSSWKIDNDLNELILEY